LFLVVEIHLSICLEKEETLMYREGRKLRVAVIDAISGPCRRVYTAAAAAEAMCEH